MKKRKYISTSAAQSNFLSIAKRLVQHTVVEAAAVIEPSVSLIIDGKNIKERIGNPYGILPFAMSASREELIQVAQALEASKYIKTENGDYYGAWLAGHRQRIIEGVLAGMQNFKLEVLQ